MTAIGQWIISEQTDEWPPQDPLHPYFQKKKEYDIKLADGRHESTFLCFFFFFFFSCSSAILPPIKILFPDQLIVLCMWDKINARVCTLPKPPNPDRYVVTRKGLDPNGLLSQRPMEKGQRAPKRKRQLGIWKRRLIHRDMLKAGKDNTCSGCFVRGRTCPECKKK